MPRMSDLAAARHAALLCVLAALITVPSAYAAYPGKNGKVAATHTDGEIVVIDPVTGAIDPIGGSSLPSDPVWSPDGSRIAYQSRDLIGTTPQPGEIHVINADGTGDVTLASDPADDNNPSWSPDGTKIVFDSTRDGGFGVRELYVMNADGTNVQRLTNLEELEGQAHSPAWSPDGTQIAYIGRISTLQYRLRIINVDGSADQAVTPENFSIASVPDWAPDASRIMVEGAFSGNPGEFFTVEPDGSNLAALPNTLDDGDTGSGTAYYAPKFSPDGTRIVFASNQWIPNAGAFGLMSQRLDGTDRRIVANPTGTNEGYGGPDWQPVPFNGYARPKGASPLRVPLVTAFQQCDGPDRVPPDGTPNRTHGPPLAYPSCNPPVTISSARVGTPDATGSPAKSVGVVRYRAIVGAPGGVDDADLAITFDVTDVLCRGPNGAPFLPCGAPNRVGASEDYAGELRATVGVRITDKDNGGPPGAGTMSDTSLSVTAPCVDNADTTIGASCSVTTTAEAVIPGSVKEGQRAIWQMGQVTVFDGGPDGDAETPTGDKVFLRQGIFIP